MYESRKERCGPLYSSLSEVFVCDTRFPTRRIQNVANRFNNGRLMEIPKELKPIPGRLAPITTLALAAWG